MVLTQGSDSFARFIFLGSGLYTLVCPPIFWRAWLERVFVLEHFPGQGSDAQEWLPGLRELFSG